MSRAKTPPVTLTDTEVEEACAQMFGRRKSNGKNVNFIALDLPRFVEFKAVPYGDEPAQKQSERIAAQDHSRAKADAMEGRAK